jgi:SsrA-binding protein
MKNDAVKIICQNRKAYFDYFIDDVVEAGIVLTGAEVKSIRLGKANINDGFARIQKGEVFLHNAHISPYPYTLLESYAPPRTRKLLLHRRELKRLIDKTEEKGFTLIPLKLYFRGHHVKVELGLAKGKKKYDKRETMRRRDEEREMQRLKKNRN